MTEETGVNLSESMVLKSTFNWMQTNLGYLILNSINFLSELLFPDRLPWKALCLLYHKMPLVLSCYDNPECLQTLSRSSGSGGLNVSVPIISHGYKPLSRKTRVVSQHLVYSARTHWLWCAGAHKPLGPGACITFSPLCPYSLSPPYRECTAALSLTYWVVAFF